MPATPYNFTKAGLTSNDLIRGLPRIVHGLGLSQALAQQAYTDPDLTLTFVDALPGGEQTALTAAVAAYSNDLVTKAFDFSHGPQDAALLYLNGANPWLYLPSETYYFSIENVNIVAAMLASYSIIVLDKDVQFISASFPGGARTIDYTATTYGATWKAIVAKIKQLNPACRIYGYIPFSMNGPDAVNWQLSDGEIQSAIDECLDPTKLGLHGWFGDQWGADFSNTRARQNTAIAYTRTTWGSAVCGSIMPNSADPADTFSSAVKGGFNPGGVAPLFGGVNQVGGGDVCCWESQLVNWDTSDTEYTKTNHMRPLRGTGEVDDKVQLYIAGRKDLNVALLALNAVPQGEGVQYHEDMAFWLSVLMSVEYLNISYADGWGDRNARQRDRIDLDALLGSSGLYDPFFQQRSLDSIMSSAGTPQITGYSSKFERCTAYWRWDSTVGRGGVHVGSWRSTIGEPSRRSADDMWKPPVRVLLDANVNLALDTAAGYGRGKVAAAQQGDTLKIGDYVYPNAQSTAAERRLYQVVGFDNWDALGTGAADYVQLEPAAPMAERMSRLTGARFPIIAGTYAGKVFVCTNAREDRVGETGFTLVDVDRIKKAKRTEKGHAGALIATTAQSYAARPGTNVPYPGVGFPTAVDSAAVLWVTLPSGWDGLGFTLDFSWTADDGNGTPAEETDWEVQARQYRADDPIDVAYVADAATASSVYTADKDRHAVSIAVASVDGAHASDLPTSLAIKIVRKGTTDDFAGLAYIVDWALMYDSLIDV